MTVTSTNYSSLDEVWGESFSPSQKTKKEKRKKIHDPICELYEMGNNSGYNENDIISYANNYFEKYDKTPYQRSMNNDIVGHESVVPHHESQIPGRERPVREVAISEARKHYDVTDADDVSENLRAVPPQPTVKAPKEKFQASRYNNYLEDDDDNETSNEPTNFAFIDLLLYIVSGIILIFIMEQFVKIGLLLQ